MSVGERGESEDGGFCLGWLLTMRRVHFEVFLSSFGRLILTKDAYCFWGTWPCYSIESLLV